MRLCLTIAATLVVFTAAPALAQQQQKMAPPPGAMAPGKPAQGQPPGPPQQAQPSPPKPYKPVAIKLPEPVTDPSFEAFRKQVSDAAQKKDRAALSKLVVAQGFFWDRESGDGADKKKPGVDNLATALGLNNKDSAGWDMLAGYSQDPTASPTPDHKGSVCAPADPTFNDKDLGDLLKATKTDVPEWGYPVTAGVEVRDKPQKDAAVVDKLGLNLVRVLPESTPGAAVAAMIRVVLPSGKTGYISSDALAPLGNDQICYIKDASGWKISGYVGGGESP
ncbi:MAG TPA: hypothetical protein VFB45_21620 [Pseudolabrys sp.]|nr:hypothetical protein [Pseudolabrys sp.]